MDGMVFGTIYSLKVTISLRMLYCMSCSFMSIIQPDRIKESHGMKKIHSIRVRRNTGNVLPDPDRIGATQYLCTSSSIDT